MKLLDMIMKKKYTLLILIIYLLIFTILISISLHYNLDNVINGGDTDAYLDPSIPLQKGWYIWEDSSFGRINLLAYIQLFYALPLVILNLIFPISIVHFLYWIILFTLIPFSCYILSFYFTKNHLISFFVGMLYSLNLFTAIVHHTPVYHLLFYHGVTPLLIYLSFKFFEKDKIINGYMILYTLLFIPLLRIINMYALYLIFLPFLAFITLKYYKNIDINMKIFIKKFIVVTVIIGIISSPYIITFYTSYSNQLTESDPNIDFSKTSVEVSKTHANLLNIIRFSTTYGWENEEFWTETSGVQGFNAAEAYHTNPLLILLTFFPFLLTVSIVAIISNKVNRRIKKYCILLICLLLLFIFIAKMINPPFGAINNFLYDSFTVFLLLFRSAWQYMQVPILIIMGILLSIGLKKFSSTHLKTNKKFISLISILILLNIVYILPAISINSNLINESWIVEIPDEYYEVAEFFNTKDDAFRILPLPLSKHFTGYIPYDWNYAGPDVLYSLLNKPLVDKIHNPVLSTKQLSLISEIEEQSHKDLFSLIEYAKRLNVKYLILRNNVNESHRYIKLWSSPTLLNQSISALESIKNTYQFGNLTIFEIDYYPRIYAINQITQVKNISHVSIGSNNSITLSYDEKYESVQSFSFNLSFYLSNKSNEYTDDWQLINHGIVFSNMFKISISPSGTIWLFLYTIDGGFQDYILQLTKNDVIEKNVHLQINMDENKISIKKDGFLYQYPFNSTLYNNLSFIKIGGEINSEKMVGKIFDYSLIINNKFVSTMDHIIENQPGYVIFNEYQNITNISNLSNYLFHSNLSNLHEITGEWNSINSLQHNPTSYSIRINTDAPIFLCLAESYDPNWEMQVYKEGTFVKTIQTTPIFSTINGFFINETGNMSLSINYKPQQWFNFCIVSSFLVISICLIYILLDFTNNIITVKKYLKNVKGVFKEKND